MNLLLFMASLSVFGLQLVSTYISIPFLDSSFLSTKITMTQPISNCSDPAIESKLKIWLDSLLNQEGSLPSSTLQSAVSIQGPETHVLSVKLSLINQSIKPHTARVLSGSWQQGDRHELFVWELQPDLSPLYRFEQIETLLIKLQSNQPVYVHLNMEINGQACVLKAKASP